MTENQIATIVIGSSIKVHKKLGPGLLESVYQECLVYEINKSNLLVEKQKPLPLIYEEVKLDLGYRVDIMVENKFIIELKSIDEIHEIHKAQVLTYLKLSNCKLGMIINFNVTLLKHGIKRVINGYL